MTRNNNVTFFPLAAVAKSHPEFGPSPKAICGPEPLCRPKLDKTDLKSHCLAAPVHGFVDTVPQKEL